MNAKKLLSTLLSAAMAVSMLAGCFGGGGNKNYSDEAADAANAAQSTVVFSTDATLAKSLQDALADGLTQLDEIDDAMEADENLKPLLTSGWDLDIFAAQGEDAEAAAKTIAEQYIVSAVIGKKAEGKIAMVLHDGNGYYYVAVLTYGNGGSGSGGGAGGGSGSGDDGQGGDDDDKPGPDDDENSMYDVTVTWEGDGTVTINGEPCKSGESVSLPSGTEVTIVASDSDDGDYVFASWTGVPAGAMQNGNKCIISSLDSDLDIVAVYKEKAPETYTVTVNADSNGTVTDEDGNAVTSINVTEGGSVTLKVAANDTFQIESLTVNNTLDEAATGNYDVYELTLENITENKDVNVSFEKCDVTGIVVKENPDQMTYEDGETFKPDGMVITVTYEDGKTEEIDKGFTCETDPLTPDNNEVTITYEGKETTLDVNVNEKKYIVNVSMTGEGGYPTPLGDTFVTAGDDFSFTVKLNDKYHKVESITVKRGDSTVKTIDSEAFAESESYTVDDINSDVVITVTFAERDVIGLEVEGINDSYKVGEKINADDVTVIAKYEGDVEKTLTPEEYEININLPYTFTEDDLDGVDVTVSYGDKKWSKDVTVEQNLYTVTVVSDNGTVDGAPTTVEDGKGFEFTVSPADGYEVAGAKVTNGDAEVSVDGNKITVSNVKSDIEITVEFAAVTHTVTVKWNDKQGDVELAKGTSTPITGGFTTTVNDKDSITIKVDAAKGYKVATVTAAGNAFAQSGNQYTLTNITSDITINVTFTKINPTIDRIEIDSDSDFKKEYECLEHFSPVGMEFTIYYDSNTVADGDALTKSIEVDQDMIDSNEITWTHIGSNKYECEWWDFTTLLTSKWYATFQIDYKGESIGTVTVTVRCGENFGAACPIGPWWGTETKTYTVAQHSELNK